jgi:uncharacterized protein YbjT (DUF2867 family)
LPAVAPRTAIVLGATGVVGRRVVEHLVLAPEFGAVVTITRRPVAHPSPKVRNEVVDFERLFEYAECFRGDCLFSCLGTTRKAAGSVAAQRRVDVDYQLQAATFAAANGVPHYLLVSSSYADANSRNAYTQMKGELEEAVLALPFAHISIFQPSVLVGERTDSRPAERASIVLLRALSWLPGIRRFRPIQGDEVARKMVQVSLAPAAPREYFVLDEIFPS